MSPRRRSLGSICVIASSLAALAAAACGPSDSVSNGGHGGTTSAGSGGSGSSGSSGNSGNSGSTGGDAAGGSAGPGQGGTVGSGGVGPGDAGTSGSAGTNGTSGSGGSASGSAGASGTVGTGGRGGGTAGAGGRGGAAGSAAGGSSAGATGSGGGPGCTPPTAYPNLFVTVSGHTQADSDAKVAAAWTKLFTAGASGAIYFNGPGTDESYVEDLFNGDVRTEGMGYGMMIAVQLDHQTEFDRLWTWVKNHMAQGTTGQQIAWSVTPQGQKKSSGGAPDGDEYLAAALTFASKRWGDSSGKFAYRTEAQWVLDLLRTKEFNASAHIVQFVAGSGNTDGSYVLPAFYQAWACTDTANADFWNAAVTAGRTFFHNAIDANGVIGDQSSFTGQTVKGAGSDTIRCVANIMMDHNFFNADPWQTDTYATKYGAYESTHANGVAQQSCDALLGFGLPASTGKPFVDKLWSMNVPNRDYWNGVLYMLALVHVSGNFHLYY